MKKKLLLAAFLMGSFLTVSAQETISFETAEGYTAGSIYEQNGWVVTSYTEVEGGPTLYVQNQVISAEDSSEGDQSFKITEEAEFGGQSNLVVGGFKEVAADFDRISVSFDIWMSETQLANFGFTAFQDGNYAGRFMFDYEEGIFVLNNGVDPETGDPILTYEPAGDATWAAQTWYNVELVFDYTNSTITYFLDGTQIAQFETLDGTTGFNNIAITHDNYGGYAYVDNLVIEEAEVAAIEGFNNNVLSVFPNPAKDVVNITNAQGLNNVSIIDLNGRTVKSVNFNGVSEATVNVSDLTAGVYMMNIAGEKGNSTQKIVKQ